MTARKFVPLAVSCALVLGAAAVADEPVLETEESKTLYALGLALSRNLGAFALSAEELSLVQAGMADGVMSREPKVPLEDYAQKIQGLARERIARVAEQEKAAGAEFCEKAAQEEGAERLESGLVYKELTPGDGETPGAADKVKVHYHGTLRDGSVFDSSVKKGTPATFPLGGVVPCFREGIQKMKVGGKSRLVCPSDIAYGERGSPPAIRPGATLVFEVELLEIVRPEPPAAPETPGESPAE